MQPPMKQLTPALRLDAQGVRIGMRHLRKVDPRLRTIVDAAGPCALRSRATIYEALFRSVLFQQLAGAAATTILKRVCAPYGTRIPTPAQLLAAPDEQLRAAGLSRQKLSYLRDLAAAFADGRLRPQQLARRSDEDIVAAVTTVHGIGEWTAHMLLIFCLRRPDVLPVGDYGVRKGMQRVYELADLPKPPEMHRIAEPWRPYRSLGAWYLWRSLEIELPDG